jgi:type I restriction enzyme R subunit
LDTGFDCPEVVNLVFARFTKSAILYQQMRGRGTRKSRGKPLFTMFDFVGVTDYHGDEDAAGQGGAVAEPRPAKPRREPPHLLVVEIDDHIDPLSRSWITVDEDGRFIIPEASEAKSAEVGKRFEAWLLGQSDLTSEQRRWLGYVGSQIRANADNWTEFTLGHFAFEPFSGLGGVGQAVRVFGGATTLEARLASLNSAVYAPFLETMSPGSAAGDYQGDTTQP